MRDLLFFYCALFGRFLQHNVSKCREVRDCIFTVFVFDVRAYILVSARKRQADQDEDKSTASPVKRAKSDGTIVQVEVKVKRDDCSPADVVDLIVTAWKNDGPSSIKVETVMARDNREHFYWRTMALKSKNRVPCHHRRRAL